MTVTCRLCGTKQESAQVQALVSWYLVHSVKQHWAEINMLHDADPELIAGAIASAEAEGWIGDSNG